MNRRTYHLVGSSGLSFSPFYNRTKETFVNGWVHTGDEVVINKDGDVFIVDRLKEILKVRGFQVAPAELEGFLLDHPLVGDVGVVGFPDEYSGEVPLAFIALSESAKKSGKSEHVLRKELVKVRVIVACCSGTDWLIGSLLLIARSNINGLKEVWYSLTRSLRIPVGRFW